MNTIAPLPVVVPLAAAAIVLFAHGLVPRAAVRAVTAAAVLAEIALAATLVHQTRSATIVYWFGGWTPRHGVALGISFTIDQLGAGAALLAGIAIAAAATAMSAMREADGIAHALLLTLLAAMAGFCLTGDLFNLFVFFELMAVSAFALAAYHTTSLRSLRGALNFAITNSIGAFLLLIGVAMLYSRTGALNLAQIGHQLAVAKGPDRLVVVAFSLVAVGFLIKAAVIPFHFWLVDTVTSAPIPLVVILAGALDTLGVYGLARVYWTVFAGPMGGHRAVGASLVVVAAGTALTAAALSLTFREPRRRLAFVMVAHTGIVLVGVGCLSAKGLAGSALYAVGDGTVKAALFVALGSRRARELFVIGGLATAGLPLFATGIGKGVVEDAARRAGYGWVTPLIVLAAAATGAAVLQLGIGGGALLGVAGAGTGETRAGAAVASVLLALSAAGAFLGRWAAAAASRFVDTAAYQQVVLTGRAGLRAPVAPAAGLSAGGIALDLLAVAAAVGLAVGLRPGSTVRWGRVWAAAGRLHDGSIGDSATWVTVGTATLALVLTTTVR